MLSDSDDRVSDHGRQIVESIENYDDVVMGGLDGYDYEALSQHASEPEDTNANNDEDGDYVEGEDEEPEDQLPPSYQRASRKASSDFSPEETDSDESADSAIDESDGNITGKKSRKRRLSPESGLQVEASTLEFRPMKQTRGSFNRDYLDLLNEDIKHAASQYVPPNYVKIDGRSLLPPSQVGMTVWTAAEKEQFFEALGRLGRDNTEGIAQRIRTKSGMEVRQYMKLLQDALAHRQRQNLLDPLEMAHIPAALELSHDCCQALEAVADNIALKQDKFENRAEKRQRGPEWLVTKKTEARELPDEDAENATLNATSVFRTSEWLALSERFFMNAQTGEGNWRSVDGNTPSIRRTTLEDFQSLALTLTKRLVSASLYIAASRVRAERTFNPGVQDIVKEKDVHAAILSLGIAPRKLPLTRTAQRLGLLIYKDPPKPDENDFREALDYEDVEDALGIDEELSFGRIGGHLERMAFSSDDSSTGSDISISMSDTGEDSADEDQSIDDDSDIEDIKAEAEEAIFYSTVDPPQTERDKEALFRRITAERILERYADAVDAQASFQEEKRMWEMLGRQPPQDFTDPGPPPSARRHKITVDAGYSVGKDWRANTEVMSEWETQYQGAK